MWVYLVVFDGEDFFNGAQRLSTVNVVTFSFFFCIVYITVKFYRRTQLNYRFIAYTKLKEKTSCKKRI